MSYDHEAVAGMRDILLRIIIIINDRKHLWIMICKGHEKLYDI